MRAISLWQPWASLWIHDFKVGETRDYRAVAGPLAIAATKTIPRDEQDWVDDLCETPIFVQYLKRLKATSWRELPAGVVLGTCELLESATVESVRDRISETELEFGNFEDGRHWWKAVKKVPFDTPVPARGSQGFWNWNPDQTILTPAKTTLEAAVDTLDLEGSGSPRSNVLQGSLFQHSG